MAKEKECCDIKVIKAKDGYEIKISGKDVERCMEVCMKNCCSNKSDEK